MRLGQTGKAKKLRLEKKIPLLKLENHAFSMEWCIIGLLCLLLRNVVIASMKARGGFSELIGALGPIAGEKLKHPNSEELDRKASYSLSECYPTFNMLCIFLLGENEPSVNLQNGRLCGDGNPKSRLEAAFLRYDV